MIFTHFFQLNLLFSVFSSILSGKKVSSGQHQEIEIRVISQIGISWMNWASLDHDEGGGGVLDLEWPLEKGVANEVKGRGKDVRGQKRKQLSRIFPTFNLKWWSLNRLNFGTIVFSMCHKNVFLIPMGHSCETKTTFCARASPNFRADKKNHGTKKEFCLTRTLSPRKTIKKNAT